MLYIALSFTAVLQRVASASVTVDSHLISSIGKGVLVFAAIASEDTKKEIESMAAKVLKMKLWPDETGATVCFRTTMLILSSFISLEVEAERTGYQGRGPLWYVAVAQDS